MREEGLEGGGDDCRLDDGESRFMTVTMLRLTTAFALPAAMFSDVRTCFFQTVVRDASESDNAGEERPQLVVS